MLSIVFGIASALSWGLADFYGALASRKLSVYRAVFFGNALGFLALLLVVVIYPETVPDVQSLIYAGLAGVLGSISLLLLLNSMVNGKISINAPISALFAAVLPVIVGIFAQGIPDLIRFIGFGLAIFSVWLISQVETSVRLDFGRLSTLFLPILAGLGFGFYFIFMHFAVSAIPSLIWPMIACYFTGTLMFFVFVLLRRESFVLERNAWGVVIVNVIFNLGGNLFYIMALKAGRLDISAVLSSLYPCITIFLAWVVLKERILLRQGVGLIVALIATIILTI